MASLINGDFETGDFTGWTIVSGNPAIRSSDPLAQAGTHYLSYATTATSEVMQIVAVDVADETGIDLGNKVVNLTYYQASFNGSDDGYIELEALDASQTLIQTSHGYEFESVLPAKTWAQKSCFTLLPENTRYIKVRIFYRRDAGSQSNSYFDSLVMTVDDISAQTTLQNPDAETGDMTGWNLDVGDPATNPGTSGGTPKGIHAQTTGGKGPPPVVGGTYYFLLNNRSRPTSQMSQMVSLTAAEITTLQTDPQITVKWLENSFSGSDTTAMHLYIYNGKNVLLSHISTPPTASTPWTNRSLNAPSVQTAEKYIIVIRGVRNGGSNLDSYVDNIEIIVGEPISPLIPSDVVNADFGTGDLTGWTIVSGTPSVITSDGNCGNNYVGTAAGITTDSEIAQKVPLKASDYVGIDAGNKKAVLQWHQTSNDQRDRASVVLEALDSSDGILATSVMETEDSVHPSNFWALRTVEILLPINSRKINIRALQHYVTGLNSDAGMDCFSLDTVDIAAPTSLQNGNAETGDLTGWTMDRGGPNTQLLDPLLGIHATTSAAGAAGPHTGTYFFYMENNGGTQGSSIRKSSMHQIVELTPAEKTLMTETDPTINVKWWHDNRDGFDTSKIHLFAYNADNVLVVDVLKSSGDIGGWREVAFSLTPATNVERYMIVVKGSTGGGGNTVEGYVDDITVTFTSSGPITATGGIVKMLSIIS